MKRILLAALLIGVVFGASGQTGLATYKVTPLVVSSGAFKQPTAYAPVSATGTKQQFPWYTKLDTITNTGADTLTQKIGTVPNTVYTWVHTTGISGTNTSCTVKLQASADSNAGVDWITLQTFTVTATNPAGNYLVNTGATWPYTNLRWIFTGSGTHSTSWYGGLEIRYVPIADELYDNRRRKPWCETWYID